jgi:hypothetical protein
MIQCSQCPCPIEPKFPLLRAQGVIVCQCCYELWRAIYQNAHFIGAQSKWKLEMEKLKRLRIGEDYLRDVEGEDS